MSVDTYTSYAAIRAVLGVTDLELPDTTLGLPLYSFKLMQALSSVSGVFAPDTEERTLAGHFDYINNLTSPDLETELFGEDSELFGYDIDLFYSYSSDERTSDQALLFGLISMYSTYVIAAAAGGSLSMFASKTISDGKALRTRFSAESTFQDVMKAVYDGLQSTKQAILEYLDADFTTGLTYVGRMEPDEDLVTNE